MCVLCVHAMLKRGSCCLQAAVINSTILAVKHMHKDTGSGQGGVVVNISSVVGLDPLFLLPVYSASKEAIISFTRAFSVRRKIYILKLVCVISEKCKCIVLHAARVLLQTNWCATRLHLPGRNVDVISGEFPPENDLSGRRGGVAVL